MSRWRKLCIIVGIAFCLAVFIPVAHHYQLRIALTSYISELEAKGEPMDLALVTPPPVPPEQNGVPFILNSITNLEHRNVFTTNPPVAMRRVAPGLAIIASEQPDIRSTYGTNKWEDLGQVLAAAKIKLDSLQSLSKHPILDFNLDYQRGAYLPLPHLSPLRQAADLLCAAALYNLHQSNVTAACANARLMLALAGSMSGEPTEVSQRVRMAIAYNGANVSWEILQQPNISESDLESLQQAWQSLEFIKPVERAYLMERVFLCRSMDHDRQKPDEAWQSVSGPSGLEVIWFKHRWQWFWSYSDETRALQIYQVLAEATRMAETNHSYQSAKSFVTMNYERLGLPKPEIGEDGIRMDIDEREMRWISSEDAYNSFRLLRRGLAAETAREMVIAAVALKRYEIWYQHLPGTLQELAPTIVSGIPIDWMDGEPLRYRPNTNGTFLLYSVGENGKDDGGNPSREKRHKNDGDYDFFWEEPYALDRVWPRPATPEEIKSQR